MKLPTLSFELVENPQWEHWMTVHSSGPEPFTHLVLVKFADQVLVELPVTPAYRDDPDETIAEVIRPVITRLFLEGGSG